MTATSKVLLLLVTAVLFDAAVAVRNLAFINININTNGNSKKKVNAIFAILPESVSSLLLLPTMAADEHKALLNSPKVFSAASSAALSYFSLIAYFDRPRGSLAIPEAESTLQVRQSRVPNAGLGLFTNRSLSRGTILGTYPGVLRPANTFYNGKGRNFPEAVGYSWRFTDNKYVIDPTDSQGNIQDVCLGGSSEVPFSISFFSVFFQMWRVNTALCRINEPPIGVGGCNVGARENLETREVVFEITQDVVSGQELYLDYGLTYDRSIMLPVSDFALGLIIHAQDYLFDSARDATLNSLAFEDNGSSLTDVMRNALSNSSILRSWDYKTDADFGTNDLIHTFAEQIDDMKNNIITNATMLLDEIELYLSSTNNVTDTFQDVEMSGGGFRFNESSLGLHLNISLTSGNGSSWLEGIEHEVSIIEAWEVEVEKLTLIATAAFQDLKSDTSNVMENGAREVMAVLKTKSNDVFREIQTERQQRIKSPARSVNKIDGILHEEKTWKSGGFEVEDVIQPDIALETILSIPLKTFKLIDDKQRDLGVNKGERRTRYHVGVIDNGDDAIVESSSIFSYNIGAVSHLVSSLERISSKQKVSLSFLRHQASLNGTVSTLKIQTERNGGYSFKSPGQLASEVAALETEAALTRIIHHSLSVAASIRINLARSRLLSQLKSLSSKSQYSERSGVIESDSVFECEIYADNVGAYFDRLLIYSEVVGKIKAAWNATEREFAKIHAEARSESRIATEEVHAEAAVERENEASSLERIQLVGKARLNEIIAACELFFRHLSEFLQHIVTPLGREQFMFYVGAVAVLVFTVMTLKEMITLGCVCILRFVTAPRLVREYGNLNSQLNNWFPHQARETSEIVLPTNIKERIDIVVKVASVASKRQLPLRSVLIYGEPGSGKSMVAKEIAHSIPDLPFAIMTGADIYPMGSQGPAELRRLLTWASKKRNGGIIIIDQAESALGCRARVEPDKLGDKKVLGDGSASRRYSRDCLNVVLSMTGTFGNIMLILTTSNPSKLDEAVLDRMDEIIYLPLPSALERSILLRNKFFGYFELLDNVDEHKKRLLRNKLLSSSCTSLTKAPYAVNFDAENCVFDLAVKTRGLSGRELEKVILGVMFKTHASASGVLDMELWKKETAALIKAIVVKHMLKCS